MLLADLYFTRNDFAAAAAECQKALQLDPTSWRVSLFLGQIYERQANYDLASKHYLGAARSNPRDVNAYILLGDLHAKQDMFHEAQQYYDRALAVEPDAPRAQSGLARVLIETGEDSNLALSLAQRAKQRAPADAAVSDALAWVYYKKGIYRLAIPLLQECVSTTPEDPAFQYHLGMAYAGDGREAEARQVLRRALQLGLRNSEAESAQETLLALRSP